MILLDTDHLTVLSYPEGADAAVLTRRMQGASGDAFATTIVSVEEQMRGWLAAIAKTRDPHAQIPLYQRLGSLFDFWDAWRIVPFDGTAADQFERLRRQRIHIGTQDLKIASIALAQDALLLSANLKDFRKVPGVRVECWLSEPQHAS
jgi:tRNA(fMet)-specific endonuclease VapC